METEKLYWTMVAAAIGAIWAFALFIRDRNAQAARQGSALIGRLLEIDKFLMEHPEIQKYISLTTSKPEDYFCTPEVLHDEIFYKAKSLAYYHLNVFDELLFLARHANRGLRLLRPPGLGELSDWETYIRRKLSHPLYRSILNNEGEIFGAALRDFWSKNGSVANAEPPRPWVW
jgi:hypothetical protein